MTAEEQRSEFSSLCRFYTLTCPPGQSASACNRLAEDKCLTRFKKCREYSHWNSPPDGCRTKTRIYSLLLMLLWGYRFLIFSLSAVQSYVRSYKHCWTCSRGPRTTDVTKWTWPSLLRLCLSWWSTSTAQRSHTPERGGTWAWAMVSHSLKVWFTTCYSIFCPS